MCLCLHECPWTHHQSALFTLTCWWIICQDPVWSFKDSTCLCEINKNNLTIVCSLSYDTLVTFFTCPEQPDSERTSSVCHRLFVPVLKHETILFFGGFSGNQWALSRAPKTGSETELRTSCVWAELWNLTTVREIENITRLIQDQFTAAVKSSHHLLHRDGSQVTLPLNTKCLLIYILCQSLLNWKCQRAARHRQEGEHMSP